MTVSHRNKIYPLAIGSGSTKNPRT